MISRFSKGRFITIAFTNHTLMPEALETWPVETLGRVLPRHLEIIYDINHRFLKKVEVHFPGDGAMKKKLSLIDEGKVKRVRHHLQLSAAIR